MRSWCFHRLICFSLMRNPILPQAHPHGCRLVSNRRSSRPDIKIRGSTEHRSGGRQQWQGTGRPLSNSDLRQDSNYFNKTRSDISLSTRCHPRALRVVCRACPKRIDSRLMRKCVEGIGLQGWEEMDPQEPRPHGSTLLREYSVAPGIAGNDGKPVPIKAKSTNLMKTPR